VGVHHSTVADWRKRLAETDSQVSPKQRAGRDGRTINTANIGKSKRKGSFSTTSKKLAFVSI